MPQLVAIGIDAAERSVVERMMAAGRMPHLRALAERSARFRLQNVATYRSDMAWVRFLTGRSEAALGWHGVLGFDPATYRMRGHGTLAARPFYALPDRRTVAFDLPGSVIDPAVDGVQLTGWGTHSPQWWRASSPPGLMREIDARFGTNPAFGNEHDLGWHEPARIDALAAASRIGSQRRAEAARWLAATTPGWDLLLTATSEVHTMGHHFWFGIDDDHPLHGVAPTTDLARQRMIDTFVDTDDAIGHVLDGLDPDVTVVVFALHGMQPADDAAATVLLPELLHRLHLRRHALRNEDLSAWRSAGCPPRLLPPGTPWHGYLRDHFVDGPADVLRRLGRRAPAPLYAMARRAAGKPALHGPGELPGHTPSEVDPAAAGAWRHDDIDWQVTAWYRRHWPAMPYFAVPTFDDSLLRINLAGREAHGVVPRDGYAQACAEATAFVRALVDARTGQPAVAEVTALRAADPMDPGGPNADLMVQWHGSPDALAHPTLGAVGPVPHARTGGHSTNGFAFLAGPGIEPGDRGERPAADLPPTLLALLGSPPSDTEGTPLLGRSTA